MLDKHRDPAARGALAGSETFLLGGWNVLDNHYSPFGIQAKKLAQRDPAEVKRLRLKLTRDSTWRIANTAAIHLDLLMGCLEVDDDDALVHHVGRAVEAVRAVAKLTNEITAIRNGGDQ
jgi:hypothetical protein